MRNDRLAGRTLGLSRRFPVALLYAVKSQGLTLQATRVSGINTIQLLGFQLIAESKEAITVCERESNSHPDDCKCCWCLTLLPGSEAKGQQTFEDVYSTEKVLEHIGTLKGITSTIDHKREKRTNEKF